MLVLRYTQSQSGPKILVEQLINGQFVRSFILKKLEKSGYAYT